MVDTDLRALFDRYGDLLQQQYDLARWASPMDIEIKVSLAKHDFYL